MHLIPILRKYLWWVMTNVTPNLVQYAGLAIAKGTCALLNISRNKKNKKNIKHTHMKKSNSCPLFFFTVVFTAFTFIAQAQAQKHIFKTGDRVLVSQC